MKSCRIITPFECKRSINAICGLLGSVLMFPLKKLRQIETDFLKRPSEIYSDVLHSSHQKTVPSDKLFVLLSCIQLAASL